MRTLPLALACLLTLTASAATDSTKNYLKKPAAWFATDEAKRVAGNILSWQADLGGWPKNVDIAGAPFAGKRAELLPTFDNRATTDELRFLARYYNATKDPAAKSAVERGIDYVFKAQYPNGGWPQYYPPGAKYNRYVTFNDDAMVRLLEFVRELHTGATFAFVDEGRRAAAAKPAFDRGIDCILKCQVKVDGKLTVWCAQHDEKDLSPREARAFELVSLSGYESVGITRLLMSLDRPSPEVVRAVDAAVAWFREAAIKGIRVDDVKDEKAPKGTDKRVVKDPAAPLVWARFYEIGTNKPFFSDRDSVKKYDIAEIGYERRNGYAWYGHWPQALIDKEYPAWKAKHPD